LKLNELHENSPSKKVQMVDDAHHKGHGRRRRRPVDALQLDSDINQGAAKKAGSRDESRQSCLPHTIGIPMNVHYFMDNFANVYPFLRYKGWFPRVGSTCRGFL
jgi:hypothetical protein